MDCFECQTTCFAAGLSCPGATHTGARCIRVSVYAVMFDTCSWRCLPQSRPVARVCLNNVSARLDGRVVVRWRLEREQEPWFSSLELKRRFGV